MVLVHIDLNRRNIAGLVVHLKCDPPFGAIGIRSSHKKRTAPYLILFSVYRSICCGKIIVDKMDLCVAADFHPLTV